MAKLPQHDRVPVGYWDYYGVPLHIWKIGLDLCQMPLLFLLWKVARQRATLGPPFKVVVNMAWRARSRGRSKPRREKGRASWPRPGWSGQARKVELHPFFWTGEYALPKRGEGGSKTLLPQLASRPWFRWWCQVERRRWSPWLSGLCKADGQQASTRRVSPPPPLPSALSRCFGCSRPTLPLVQDLYDATGEE